MKKLVFVLAFLFASHSFAQAYPGRAVKVVVPWPPGQATDIAARVMAQKLQESLGQPFVVDNKPGAGGSIAAGATAAANPDGYRIMLSDPGANAATADRS